MDGEFGFLILVEFGGRYRSEQFFVSLVVWLDDIVRSEHNPGR